MAEREIGDFFGCFGRVTEIRLMRDRKTEVSRGYARALSGGFMCNTYVVGVVQVRRGGRGGDLSFSYLSF